MSRKKHSRRAGRRSFAIVVILLVVIVCTAGGIFLKHLSWEISRENQMMKRVGLSFRDEPEIVDYTIWNDFLKYTSGYEILLLKVDPLEWSMPAGWRSMRTTLNDASALHNVNIQSGVLDKLEADSIPDQFVEYYFEETGRDEELIYDWEFYTAFYDGAGTVLIYRGFNLYGDSWLRYEE